MIDHEDEYGPEADFTCGKHGTFRGRPWVYRGHSYEPPCGHCEEDRTAERSAEEDREAERRAEMSRNLPYIAARIPRRFYGATFDSYAIKFDGQATATKTLRTYARVFEARRRVGGGLILLGKVGTGKTHLLAALAHALHPRWAVRYTDVASLIASVKGTYRKDARENEDDVIRGFTHHDLLMLDEVGVGHGSDNDRAILHRVIDLRYQLVKPTIVAGNIDGEGLVKVLGDRAVSRLLDNAGVEVTFDWEDYRRAA